MLRLALALSFTLLIASVAQAQPQILVSPSEVPAGSTVTVTINAPAGYFWALVGSSRDSGLAYGGVALGVGTDAQVLATGVIGPGGTVSMPFTPPIGGGGLDTYYLMAAIALSPDFVPPTPSATVAVRQRGFYTNTPTFPQGLAVGGSTVQGLAWPSAPGDAAPKAYVDAVGTAVGGAATALAPAATQPASSTTPIISVEQRGSGDLLNLRVNSTTVPGYGGINPNRSQFRVLPDGGFVAGGDFLRGVIPAEGPGTRFMWYPRKGAFRGGTAVGTEWNDANVDDRSFAFGNQVTASGYGSVAFGDQVTVSSTVGFGAGSANIVSGTAGVSFGASNTAGGFTSAAIGYTTRAMGQGSMALGYRVAACGDYTVALGYRASTASAPTGLDLCAGTQHDGSFVFSDASDLAAVYWGSSAANQISMRFAGGYRLFTNSARTTGMILNAGGSSWNVVSDRNAKYGFQPVDTGELLERLMRVPIQAFYYKDGDGQRYIGPIAQDFHAAFGLGDDDKTIRMSDLDGVALASIQALARRVQHLEHENAALREQASANEHLEDRLRALEARLTALDERRR